MRRSERTNKAVTTSSAMETATWAMTKILRAGMRNRRGKAARSRMASSGDVRVETMAGMTPQTRTESAPATMAKVMTRKSMRKSGLRGKPTSGMKRWDGRDEPLRQDEGKSDAGDGQQRVFRDQLADEVAAHGAEGGAHGDFTAAGIIHAQQQVGNVDAGEQQHRRADGEKEDGQNLELQRTGNSAPNRRKRCGLIGLGKPGGEARTERLELRAGLIEGCAGTQARIEIVIAERTRTASILVEPRIPGGARDIDLRVHDALDAAESGGKYGDDSGRTAGGSYGAADDGGIAAEDAPPGSVAKDDNGGFACEPAHFQWADGPVRDAHQ